ncbi:response regulator transcription factor [Nonomuraea sp. LPB2021202275-12-8]|uniref:response regulator transcription factor n=1 Tax=Nonomuraea sp. LPB2021202275-12-8 TaxID=3120159 RepID=UPI00300CC37F
MTVRVLVADDQTVVREGLVLLLGLLPGTEVVGAAADGEEAVRMVAELAPDIVLMDLRMPRLDGVGATRAIRAAHPGTQIVVLSTYSDDEAVFAALRAGARGYLTKDTDAESLAKAIAVVAGGEAHFAPPVQRRLAETVADRPSDVPRGRPGDATPGRLGDVLDGRPDGVSSSRPDGLTQREVEVLTLIAQGRSNAEIATQLYISEATVKSHINNLFAKTRVRDRAQAVTYAFRHGLIPS